MDKVIADVWRKRNSNSLVHEASGKEQPSKHKVSAPATATPDAVPAAAVVPKGTPPPSPGLKKGKGKGKGKGQSGSGSDSETGFGTDQYPGVEIKDIPEDQRCCIFHLYVDKNGASCCKTAKSGKECKMQHLPHATKAMLKSKVYNKYCALWGMPNAHQPAPAAAGQ